MAGLAPLVDRRRRRARQTRPTVQEAACWVGICRPLDEHVPGCPRRPTEFELVQAQLHWKLRQRREER